MSDRVMHVLSLLSVRTYSLVLQVYPCEFRREFGESMTLLYGDLARDACRQSGLIGLVVLWMRTLVDVLTSVIDAYASDDRRNSMFRTVVAVGVLYVCALALSAGYGAIRYSEFYDAPAFSQFSSTGPTNEDALIAAYEQSLTGEFGRYKTFAFAAGLVLAILLGIGAALFGLWQESILHGAGAFIAGTVLTIGVFEFLPTIWFPFDRYPVGALWVMGGGLPTAAGIWLLVTAIGRFGPWRDRLDHA